MSLPLTASGAMSLDLTEFLPCRATAEPVSASTRRDDRDQHRRRGQPPSHDLRSSRNLSCRSLTSPLTSNPRLAVSFGRRDEDLGRLHRRGAPARPAAGHRAAARRAGDEVEITDARVRADGRASSSGSASSTRSSAATPTARPRRRALAVARRSRALGALGAGAALRPRARPRLGRPRRGQHAAADPIGADAGLRVRRPAAQARLPRRAAGCSSPTRSRSSDCAAPGPAERKLFRYPGPEGGLLPRRLRARPARSSTSSASTRDGGARSSSARRPRPRPITSATPLYDAVLDRLAADQAATAGRDPAHRGPGRTPCGPARTASLIVPERAIDAQSLIAYADLVVSAGGTMNREAVALGTPVLHDLQRPDGRRRRGA